MCPVVGTNVGRIVLALLLSLRRSLCVFHCRRMWSTAVHRRVWEGCNVVCFYLCSIRGLVHGCYLSDVCFL